MNPIGSFGTMLVVLAACLLLQLAFAVPTQNDGYREYHGSDGDDSVSHQLETLGEVPKKLEEARKGSWDEDLLKELYLARDENAHSRIDSIGGGNIVRNTGHRRIVARGLDSIGGGNIIGRSIGGGTRTNIVPSQDSFGDSHIRELDSIGGGNVVGRGLESFGDDGSFRSAALSYPYLNARGLDTIGGGNIVRAVDSIGGGNIVRGLGSNGNAYRSVDTIGGGNIVRNLDSLGGGNVVRGLDTIGGGNIVRNLESFEGSNGVRSLDPIGGGNIVRSVDSIGGGNIVRSLDPIGGGNIVRSVGAFNVGNGRNIAVEPFSVRALDSIGGGNIVRDLDYFEGRYFPLKSKNKGSSRGH